MSQSSQAAVAAILRSESCGPLRGELQVPGDKSISHRSVMFGSLALGTTAVHGLLMGEDVRATMAAFASMGVEIDVDESGNGHIQGVGKHGLQAPEAPLDMGNSGTAMRLLAGVMAGQSFASSLIGDASLMRRPMARVAKPLAQMGANVTTGDEGRPPIKLQPVQSLRAINYDSPVASAQVKSCVLLAGLYGDGITRVTEPRPSRDHSERMLAAFGAKIESGEGWAEIHGASTLTATDIMVPGDISSAAFWLVAASIVPGSDLLLPRVGINRRRAGVLTILRAMGADFELGNQRELGGEPVADIRVRYSPLKGIDIPAEWVPDAIDEFPVLFVAAACAQGRTTLTGAEELRVKESDRIATMARALGNLGVALEETPDGIVIDGGAIRGGTVHADGDHRIAMASAVAGMVAQGPVIIHDAAHIATSYPHFDQQARSVGAQIGAADTVPVLAIDGPSGSGKGTVAARLAQAMGWHLLDSGALYRLVGYAALARNLDLGDEEQIALLAAKLKIEFDSAAQGAAAILLDGEPVADKIRDEQVANAASQVAALPKVRQALFAAQRDFQREPGLVADGRDMGTVVFPEAQHKVFLTASAEERAERRYKQLKDKDNGVTLRALFAEIKARDERDANRTVAPLKPADDAVLIDTTKLSIDQVVDQILGLLR